MAQNPISRTTAERWENEGGALRFSPEVASMGVTRIMTATFSVGGYRYTNLADAVAQARRQYNGSPSQ
jgi:hypothetical protein